MPEKKKAMKAKKAAKKIAAFKHGGRTRANIPTAEDEEIASDDVRRLLQVTYSRNRDLDPQLVWHGKDEENSEPFHVQVPPIYIQEKISPEAIINDLRRRTADREQAADTSPTLFRDAFNGAPDDDAHMEFYRHPVKWTNRMILGDSLMVMASLAHREGLKGQVQCIYMDPPYGIKFSSNWQTSTRNTNVTDHDETHEPEAIQAFRDTWKKGVHSYLSYLRARLMVSRDLLSESGSIFVQIGDENVHRVAALMDEVFGAENRIATISYATTSGSSTKHIPQVADYLLWYAKNAEHTKYCQLYEELDRKEVIDFFNWDATLELATGETRPLTDDERYAPDKHIPEDVRAFQRRPLLSQGASTTGRSEPYTWRGRVFPTRKNSQWSISREGMDRMDKANRLHASEKQDSLMWKRYESEVPGRRINNLWHAQMRPTDKRYVVQTYEKVIQRCILMATAPGDLVLDPTCGSGTTASVAEQWGRRWITADTSRVALAIARARLMGNRYEYYLMQDSEAGAKKEAQISGKPSTQKTYAEDVSHGFVYHRVNTLSPKDVAANAEIDTIWDKWREKMEPLRHALNSEAGEKWEEWQIPRQMPAGTKAKVKAAHVAWQKAHVARQKEIDASVTANARTVLLVDRPYATANSVRVTGPFTVESLSPHRVLPVDDKAAAAQSLTRPKSETSSEESFLQVVFENLKQSGVNNTRKNERLKFADLQIWPKSNRIQFIGLYEKGGKEKRAAICVGPEYGTVPRTFFVKAAREALDSAFDTLIVLGFAFEARADDKNFNFGEMEVIRARMNSDLHMAGHLKGDANDNLFVTFGEPDIELRTAAGAGDMLEVEIAGVDIYNPTTGEVKSDGVEKIACWFIDTNYDEASFFVHHAYFTGDGKDPYENLKRALISDIDEESWASLNRSVSRPFPRPQTGKIAIKAINHYGDELLRVIDVKATLAAKK